MVLYVETPFTSEMHVIVIFSKAFRSFRIMKYWFCHMQTFFVLKFNGYLFSKKCVSLGAKLTPN